jgi:hypothetical protein
MLIVDNDNHAVGIVTTGKSDEWFCFSINYYPKYSLK